MKHIHDSLLKGLLCLLICFIPAIAIYGEDSDFQQKKDSLLKVIVSTKGEEKLDAYKAITHLSFPEEEMDLMLRYLNDFISEARKQHNKEYEHLAYRAELACLYNYSKFDEFKQRANIYLPFFKKNGFQESYYRIYSSLLLATYWNEDNKDTQERIKQMYAKAKQENCLFGIAQTSLLIAIFYDNEARYDDADKYFRESIEIALKLIKEKTKEVDNYNLATDGYLRLAYNLQQQGKIEECISLMSVWRKHLTTYEKTFGYPDKNLMNYYSISAFNYVNKGNYDKAKLYCDSMELTNLTPQVVLELYRLKYSICMMRNDYDSAIEWLDKNIELAANYGELSYTVTLLHNKAKLLSGMGHCEESFLVSVRAFQLNDSLNQLGINAQLDEIRTQYEVDKHIAEKTHLRSYIYIILGIFVIVFTIYTYYSRKITKKNRTLAQQIKKLAIQQEEQFKEMQAKAYFIPEVTIDEDICVESKMNKLCVTVYDLFLKDKAYHNPIISQELAIEMLDTNKKAFSEALEKCFKMPFGELLNFFRLKEATLLLEQSDLTIEGISKEVGFGTVRTFRRQFIDKYNMTPKDYRNSFKK